MGIIKSKKLLYNNSFRTESQASLKSKWADNTVALYSQFVSSIWRVAMSKAFKNVMENSELHETEETV
jgi:hypothetical protein